MNVIGQACPKFGMGHIRMVYNEYYVDFSGDLEKVGGARFRLVGFTSTGAENLLSPSTPQIWPGIVLVNGEFWVWSKGDNGAIDNVRYARLHLITFGPTNSGPRWLARTLRWDGYNHGQEPEP